MSSPSGHKLGRQIALRLLYGAVSLLFISLATFLIDEVAPGDAALVRAGEKATAQQVQRIREEMGLDRPWPIRYVEFLGKAVRFDFGESYYGIREPVSEIIKRNLPATIRLSLMSIVLAAAIGIMLGTVAAVYEGRAADRAVLSVSTLGVTIPNFVLAPLLVYLFVLKWDMLPLNWEIEANRIAPEIYYLILPVVILAARPMAMLTRLTRASMIETLQQEFIRLAVAKGVPSLRLYLVYALRNAILPVVTAIGTSFGFLLTGSFIIETIFTMPGIGHAAIEAIQKGDTPVILATVMIAGALFIFVNLVVDLMLPALDPRIRESQV